MLNAFRKFIARGNVLDLAIAVMIGAAFNDIVSSLVQDVLTPVIGIIFGDLNFDHYYLNLSGESVESYQAAREAGLAVIGYGSFITAVINFLIIAFVLFLLVRAANRIEDQKKEEQQPKAPELTKDQQLLTEIRDLLDERRS